MVILPGCLCCVEPCNVNQTRQVGGEASGLQGTYSHFGFISGEACIRVQFSAGFPETQVRVRVFPPAQVIFLETVAAGPSEICILKPAGGTSIEIRITDPDNNNFAWQNFTYTVTCNTCDCNPLP